MRLLGLLTAVVLATTSSAHAECYPPNPGHQGRVDRTTAAPGDCVTFSGDGYRPNSTITITDNGEPAGTVKADKDGAFSKVICYGADAEPGPHELVATGPDAGGKDCGNNPGKPGERQSRGTVFVLGAGVVAPPPKDDDGDVGGNHGGLPFTGDISATEALLGALLLLVGAGALLAGRPRPRRTA